MSAIQTCKQCGRLYTGSTSLCLICVIRSTAASASSAPSQPAPSQASKNRAERRALAKREAKAERRVSQIAQPPVYEVLSRDCRPKAQLPRTTHQKDIKPNRKKQLIQPGKRTLDAGSQPASPAVSVCHFCFFQIERDRMKTHLREAHGRDPYGSPLPQPDGKGSVFAFSGGLPSLGKRR